jgi:hypothetical protein
VDPSSQPPTPYRFTWLAALAFTALLIGLLVAVAWPLQRHRLWGDEGTYLAMTASLVRDADLQFGESDLEWLSQRELDSPVTVILQQTLRGITYSKPIFYPLVSAPLFALLGERGIVATQSALLTVALALAWVFLRALSSPGRATATLATFVLCSVVLVYVSWKMSDLLLFSLTLAGLLLALGGRDRESSRGSASLPFGSGTAAIAGGLLLGATVAMRYTTAAIVAGAVLGLLLDTRWRRAVVVGVMSLTAFLAISGATQILLGTTNPYKAVRSSFNQETGYPTGDSADQAAHRFTRRPATQSASWRPPFDARRTAYSSLYFLIGRHTGILLYFPVAVMLLLHLLRRPDRVSLSLLAGLAAMVGFYLVWMPQNYFGGSTFVGNRYFLGAFPVLFVALRRLPSQRTLGFTWALSALIWGSAAYSMRTVSGLDDSSQSHAFAGIFRLMPAESTGQRIDGLQERFWADDYLRFQDPFAEPARWSFRLDSTRPAAEIMVATSWSGDPLQFVIAPQSAPIEIDISDWKRQATMVVPLEPPNPPGLLEISLSEPWRLHAFWWKPGTLYRARVLRFSLRSPMGDETTAVVRYAGRGRELRPLSGILMNRRELSPIEVTAGSQTQLPLKVRNTGSRPWRPDGIFPHRLGYRLSTQGGGSEVASQAAMLTGRVPPGKSLDLPLSIRWPDEPGSYELIIEIRREPTDRLGPLGRTILETLPVAVEPRVSPDSQEP